MTNAQMFNVHAFSIRIKGDGQNIKTNRMKS